MLALPLIFLATAGCGSSNKLTGNEQANLDQNFIGYTGVVLVKRNYGNKNGYNSIDKTVNQTFKKYYKGEYMLVTGQELGDYLDPVKYRFVITPGYYNGGSGVQTNIDMFDRKTGKITRTKFLWGYAAWDLYIALLEKMRTGS
jgi:hypothetical protein